MFKVIFPMLYGVSRDQIIEVLPDGWTVVCDPRNKNRYSVYKKLPLTMVGKLIIQPERILIAVDEKHNISKLFWEALGNKYPELNPYNLRYGVVYLLNNKNNIYGFDDLSDKLDEATSLVSHYIDKYSPFLIPYFQGDYHWGAQIKAQSYASIYRSGQVGEVVLSPRYFKLENK